MLQRGWNDKTCTARSATEGELDIVERAVSRGIDTTTASAYILPGVKLEFTRRLVDRFPDHIYDPTMSPSKTLIMMPGR